MRPPIATTRTLISFYESHGGAAEHVAGLRTLLSALERNDLPAAKEAYVPFSRPAMGSFLESTPTMVYRDEYATEIWEALLWRWKEFMDRYLEIPSRIRGDGTMKRRPNAEKAQPTMLGSDAPDAQQKPQS